MALSVHALASGSSGNAILLKCDGAGILIDAGLGVRRLAAALAEAEMNPTDLSAILITHEHSDHIAGAVRAAGRFGATLVSNAETLSMIPWAEHVPHKILEPGGERTLGCFHVRSFAVSHDAANPVGYSIECLGRKVCTVTDTGILTSEARAEAACADLLILESNHDVHLLRTGPYPAHLKHRIAGAFGHLSNEDASALLSELAELGRPKSVWLAHLSATNNTPGIALATARAALPRAARTTMRIDVALRGVPSLRWRAD